MKKAKPTKITKMDKKDSYGNTSFIIEFDNSDKGFYTSKSEEQTKFIIGTESEYEIEERTGAKGKYYKVTIPQSGKPQFGGGKPQIDPKVQMISFAMSYTKDLIVAGKIPLDKLKENFNIIYSAMTEKI